jgi:radical SAM superfamily enzyme YgiQ (UPF0313 family)
MLERLRQKISEPKVTLLYPPNQTMEGYMCKPNGSLAYPNLGGSLLAMGIEVKVFDACVGNEKDDLNEVFYKSSELPNSLYRTGVSEERILEEIQDSHIIGLTSIFTAQESMVLETAKLIKKNFPEKIIIAGGVNARNRLPQFLARGIDIVFVSEAELTLQKFMRGIREGDCDLSKISGIAYLQNENIISNKTKPDDVIIDLDLTPMPAWHLLPNERYWQIARPHGGHFEPGSELRYASMMTSMGCVFACSYCHIAKEVDGEVAGNIGKFRVKSDQRVLAELDELKRLGIKQLFVEDDTLFGYKRRAIGLLRKIKGYGFEILDVNGVNFVHLFRNENGAFVPDHEVLEVLVEAGFKEIVLAFESGSQRIITKYASNKWIVDRFDIGSLLKAIKSYDLRVNGNYMLGYPDETRAEMDQTIALAKLHRKEGLDVANFFCVLPLPGTPIFEWAIAGGHIQKDFNPDIMNWTLANMKNTPVPSEELELLRSRAWREVNDGKWVEYKMSMNVSI